MDGTLLNSIEKAFVAYIKSANPPANVYEGHASTNKILPFVACVFDGGSVEEDPPLSGNFWIDGEIQVKATAATEFGGPDPEIADVALVGTVFNLVKVDNLDALLNAQGQNLTAFPRGYFFGSPKAGTDELGGWVDYLPVKIYACPKILAP